jgi:dihydroneopterin triphosphate diphosphatase
MPRAPFQVLVLPFVRDASRLRYAVFRRADMAVASWQGIAGGGESGERPIDTARRESFEEAGIPADRPFFQLQSTTTIPVVNVCGFVWGPDVLVVPEWTFGVELESETLHLSHEHSEAQWCDYEHASRLLRWDSNRSALWELDYRIRCGTLSSDDARRG